MNNNGLMKLESICADFLSEHDDAMARFSHFLAKPPPPYDFSGPRHPRALGFEQRQARLPAILGLRRRAEESIDLLKSTMHELEEAVAQHNIIIQMLDRAVAPIKRLPFELIQDIIQFAVPAPRSHNQIMKLSHISSTWRAATLALSKLFVSPQWETWSVEFCSYWASRTGPLGLQASVYADDFPPHPPTFVLERSCLSITLHADRLVRLHFATAKPLAPLRPPQSMMSLLTGTKLPKLEYLAIEGEFLPITISSINLPLLSSCALLDWGGSAVLKGPFPNLQHLLRTSLVFDDVPIEISMSILQSLPNETISSIKHITIHSNIFEIERWMQALITKFSPPILPQLHKLVITRRQRDKHRKVTWGSFPFKKTSVLVSQRKGTLKRLILPFPFAHDEVEALRDRGEVEEIGEADNIPLPIFSTL
ncbi:hypothetical protein DL93DRAFT_2173212 [Clavulina sp. PMI_390]|nr:hypothetical protein DL93DRAFT_2173212 [Clavulina sp. PMI_390]